MAKRIINQVTYYGGKESRIEGVGKFLLTIGILGLIACIVMSGFATKEGSYDYWGENGLSPIWLTFGIFLLIQGIVNNTFLNAGSEVIRLLKKQNGLNYAGEISKPEEDHEFICSECGFVLYNDENICPGCKAVFEENNHEQ